MFWNKPKPAQPYYNHDHDPQHATPETEEDTDYYEPVDENGDPADVEEDEDSDDEEVPEHWRVTLYAGDGSSIQSWTLDEEPQWGDGVTFTFEGRQMWVSGTVLVELLAEEHE